MTKNKQRTRFSLAGVWLFPLLLILSYQNCGQLGNYGSPSSGSLASSSNQASYYINCGGAGYTDSDGIVWSADNYFLNGVTYTNAAVTTNTSDPTLYSTERYGHTPLGAPVPSCEDLNYTFPAPSGSYTVTLMFSETLAGDDAVGKRIFNISINGTLVRSNFDIFATAGGMDIAVTESFNIGSVNNQITLDLGAITGVDCPKLDAIAIVPQ